MKKKLYKLMLFCGLVLTALCAYKKQQYQGNPIAELFDLAENPSQQTVTFQAAVLELTDTSILVEPVPNSSEFNSSDLFHIPNAQNIELQTGDHIEITYNGEILESYPAQLGEIYDIKVLNVP